MRHSAERRKRKNVKKYGFLSLLENLEINMVKS